MSTVKNPLARSTAESTWMNRLLQRVSPSGSIWNGIIFVNEIVVDNPPVNYYSRKESVLCTRTVFATGIVLTNNIHVLDSWYKDHTPWVNGRGMDPG